jgi:hypothetical protein
MKLNQKIQVKRTKKLFDNTYKYKAAVLCIFAGYFRGNNIQFAQQKLRDVKKSGILPVWAKKATSDDIDFALGLCKTLSKLQDYSIRIENPVVSFYTNSDNDLKTVTDLNPDSVKYVSIPEVQQTMEKDTIYVKKLDYGFKVTMGRTKQSQNNFLQWCQTNANKIRMPKRCEDDLSRNHSWGGGHFYVKDDKALTMVKMFLGTSIARVDRVVKLPEN